MTAGLDRRQRALLGAVLAVTMGAAQAQDDTYEGGYTQPEASSELPAESAPTAESGEPGATDASPWYAEPETVDTGTAAGDEASGETASDAAATDEAGATDETGTVAVEPLREETAPPQGGEQTAAQLDTIEVTGSRIRRADYETAQPVTVVTREDIERTGLTNIGDLLQELPSAGSALSRQFNNGGAGTTEVDLRNLGSQRVLVLVDGRRWIPGAGNYPSVDLNTIPVSIIERIEVLKDGASAVYGSDAITGVINIITRKDYSGASFQAQANVFEQGDGLQQQYSANWGVSDGTTSLFFDINFVRQEAVMAGDREISEVPSYGTGFTRGSTFSPRGTLLFIPTPANGAILGPELCPDILAGSTIETETGITLPINTGPAGLQLCDMILRPGETIDGSPDENTATVRGRYEPRNITTLDNDENDAYNFAPINYLLTPFDQTSLFTQISHQLLDNVEFTGRALYNRHKTERMLAETPLLFGDLTFPPYNDIYVAADQMYNPFDQDIGRHPGQGTPGDALGIGPGTGLVGRRFVEAGPRFLSRTTETLFLTGSFQGDFMFMDRLLNWDAGYANGRILNSNLHRGDLNMERVKRALGPSIDCVDPCVPLNLFGGPGTITQDQLDYVLYEAASSAEGKIQYAWAGIGGEITDFNGALPAPLGVALGVEYRTESFANQPDPFVQSGISSTNIQQATRGAVHVKEAYIEFDVPLVADQPLIQELGISLAGRYSDYGRFDPATTGKIGLRYKPVDQLLLRGTLSEAFRAPSVIDMYLGDTDSYPSLTDPCVGAEDGTTTAENCEAEGVNPATVQQFSSQILTRYGGNPDLEPETANSLTAGLVWSPEFVADLNFTLDYYSIEAEQFISSLSPDFILESCYEAERADGARPVTCDYVNRNSDGSISFIRAPTFNFSKIETSGVEFATDYRLPIELLYDGADELGTVKFVFDSSYLIEYNQATPNADGTSTEQQFQGSNQGDTPLPRFKFNATLDWQMGQWDASWTARFIYHTIESCDDGFAPSFSSLGLCSQPDGDLSDGTDDSRNKLDTTVYHNVQVNYEVPGWETRITLGVINLFDTDPPISRTAFANSYPGTLYEPPGRQPYIKLFKRF